MLFSHPKGNLRTMACPVHIQPPSSSHLDHLPFTLPRPAGGCATSLYSPEERKEGLCRRIRVREGLITQMSSNRLAVCFVVCVGQSCSSRVGTAHLGMVPPCSPPVPCPHRSGDSADGEAAADTTLGSSLQLVVVQLNCFSDEKTDKPPIWDRNCDSYKEGSYL